MMIPKSVKENEAVMSQKMKDENFKIQGVYLDKSIPADEANLVINEFNARWIAAGGIAPNGVATRK